MTITTKTANSNQLLRQLADARAEARALRGKLSRQNRYSKIVRRAIIDGHELMINAFSDEPTSRRAMLDAGMTERRWQWAVAFLKYAGLVATKSKKWREGLPWIVEDLDKAVALINRAAEELMRADGYKRLSTIARQRRGRR